MNIHINNLGVFWQVLQKWTIRICAKPQNTGIRTFYKLMQVYVS